MTAIKTLDQIKNTDSRIFVRWSKSFTKDAERGYSVKYGTGREAGLSACEIDPTWQDWRILRQLMEYQYCGGSCWIITGDVVGTGEDNEPLLENVQLIGKVAKSLLQTDWKEMERQQRIAKCKASLERITDPIGRRIVESELAQLEA